MTVYVDNAFIPFQRHKMCHLMSDQKDDAEIHAFAHKLGLKHDWFHGDHYDVTMTKRRQAIELGAIEMTQMDGVNIRRAKRGQGPIGSRDKRRVT